MGSEFSAHQWPNNLLAEPLDTAHGCAAEPPDTAHFCTAEPLDTAHGCAAEPPDTAHGCAAEPPDTAHGCAQHDMATARFTSNGQTVIYFFRKPLLCWEYIHIFSFDRFY